VLIESTISGSVVRKRERLRFKHFVLDVNRLCHCGLQAGHCVHWFNRSPKRLRCVHFGAAVSGYTGTGCWVLHDQRCVLDAGTVA
jgi:hypothetical protein